MFERFQLFLEVERFLFQKKKKMFCCGRSRKPHNSIAVENKLVKYAGEGYGDHNICYSAYVLDKSQLKNAKYGNDTENRICVLYHLVDNTAIYHVYELKIIEKYSKKKIQYEIKLLEKWPQNGESASIDELKKMCKGDDGDKKQALGVWPSGCKTEIRM